jgi:hypothetical protein
VSRRLEPTDPPLNHSCSIGHFGPGDKVVETELQGRFSEFLDPVEVFKSGPEILGPYDVFHKGCSGS